LLEIAESDALYSDFSWLFVKADSEMKLKKFEEATGTLVDVVLRSTNNDLLLTACQMLVACESPLEAQIGIDKILNSNPLLVEASSLSLSQ
jgi:hypothetical protein